MNGNPGDLAYSIGTAGKVLHVDRCVDINPLIEQFDHILITFAVAAAGGIGMSKFIDQHQLWPPRKDRIQIHLGQGNAPICQRLARNHRQINQQRFGLRPAMGLDVAHDHIHPFITAIARRRQHGIGLPDPSGHTKKDLQFASLRPLLILMDSSKQGIWVRTVDGHSLISDS